MPQSEIKICQNCKNSFTIDEQDFKFYEKISVPPPSFCPECRLQRRLAFRNERTLYKRKCGLCGQLKVMNYSVEWPGPVYCSSCWWSDKWDALKYGQDYDFSRPFFEQFFELRKKTPQMGLAVNYSTMLNSEYCHMANDLKNCYLVTHANNNEDCAYGSALVFSKDCYDMLSSQYCELCLECVNCFKCYQAYFSLECENCQQVYFSKNCLNCFYCFGCVNLKHKKYHIFNVPYSEKEYFEKLKNLTPNSYQNILKAKNKIKELWRQFPQKFIHGKHNQNVSGDYVYYSKNAFYCYDVAYAQDSKYCQRLTMKPISECYDYTEWGANANLIYESVNSGMGVSNSKFNQQSWENCKNIEYTSYCIASTDIFGCVSLRHAQYCILNKQYSKEKYEDLREKIIKQMMEMPYTDKRGRIYRYGEFFPVEISPWGYNETTANEDFPRTKEEAEKEGYNWTDILKHRGEYKITIKADDLADNISKIDESIIKEIIECKKCRRPYQIIKPEFEFYKNQNIALPRKCLECRYFERFEQRNSFKLYHQKCFCDGLFSENQQYQNTTQHFHNDQPCLNEFETTYAPERSKIVYCEKCYLAEVV